MISLNVMPEPIAIFLILRKYVSLYFRLSGRFVHSLAAVIDRCPGGASESSDIPTSAGFGA
jgi:hypothetical protein